MMNKKGLKVKPVDGLVKNTINSVIKHLSVIAIFVALSLVLLLYLGPEISINGKIVVRLAVPSIVLAMSRIVILELWIINGRRSASEEDDYIELLKTYSTKSENLFYPTMQSFLDYERNRRYQVEEDRLRRLLNRETSSLEKSLKIPEPNLKQRFSIRKSKQLIQTLETKLNSIKISMPYEKSEEFDYLRYNIQDVVYKEYKPSDTQIHLRTRRTKKYLNTFTFTLVGFNLFTIGGTMGNLWVAIIMTLLAAISLIMSIFSGFSTGYNNIKVISTGVYKTAISFIDQAVAYCKKEHKDLYYKGVTEFKELSVAVPQIVAKELDIFAKAAEEVTESH